VSESGVQQIEAVLRSHADRVTVFAGIRNDITSQQGLALLHDIGVKLYTVDTGSRAVIFHPKLYLVRGRTNARFVVGSANLTLGGLNNKVHPTFLWVSSTLPRTVCKEDVRWTAWSCTDNCLG
jgi:HKD family nuclease